MKTFSQKDKEYKRWYYHNVAKPRKKAFLNWFRTAEPKDIWKFYDLKI